MGPERVKISHLLQSLSIITLARAPSFNVRSPSSILSKQIGSPGTKERAAMSALNPFSQICFVSTADCAVWNDTNYRPEKR